VLFLILNPKKLRPYPFSYLILLLTWWSRSGQLQNNLLIGLKKLCLSLGIIGNNNLVATLIVTNMSHKSHCICFWLLFSQKTQNLKQVVQLRWKPPQFNLHKSHFIQLTSVQDHSSYSFPLLACYFLDPFIFDSDFIIRDFRETSQHSQNLDTFDILCWICSFDKSKQSTYYFGSTENRGSARN
jgi:hypothetical protein